MIDLKNKVIMISGANRGIGYATAKLLKEKGCILSLAARNPEEIKVGGDNVCLLYTSPSPRDRSLSRMPSSA